MTEAVFSDGRNTVNGRDANGRFVRGNRCAEGGKGGPGRPKREREERFLEITLAAVTFEDWRKIVKRAVLLAKTGNKDARKFLADYIIGPPVRRTEITGRDGGPVATRIERDIDVSGLDAKQLAHLDELLALITDECGASVAEA